MIMRCRFVFFMGCTFSLCSFVYAETPPADVLADVLKKVDELTQAVGTLQETVEEQQERIETLEQENEELRSTTPLPSVPAPAPVPVAPRAGSMGGLQINPEIGAVVDIVGALTESREDIEGNDKLSVRELELTIGSDIDPFARFDSTITFSDFEGVAVEEAFVTYWDLPAEMIARAGRMRPKIGKATAVHRDQLDTVDEPLVVQRYLGIEGLFRTAFEVSRFLPQPTENWTPEITLGLMEGGIGEDGTLFGTTRRRPSYYAHLKNFFDITPTTNLEVGGTYLLGSSDDDASNEVQALGVDATFQHHFDAVRRLKLQSELYAQDRDEPLFVADEEEDHGHAKSVHDHDFDENPWGMYALADFRLTPRWGFGTRYDYVELVDEFDLIDEDGAKHGVDEERVRGHENAYSAYVTFYQSEFARLRLQYQHAELGSGLDDDRLFLQGTFTVGTHKHQIK
jgi:hypothetical protein